MCRDITHLVRQGGKKKKKKEEKNSEDLMHKEKQK